MRGIPGRLVGTARPCGRGAALVEFTLVLVVLLVIVAGVVEFGRTLWYYDALAKGTRDAARYLSTQPPGSLNAELATARDLVEAAAESANVPSFVANDLTVPVTCSPACTAATVDTVTVRVEYPMTIGAWIPFLPAGDQRDPFIAVTLRPSTTMRYMW